MADFNWTPYLVGGAARPDAISGLNPQFSQSLQSFIADAPDHIKQQLRLTSAYRSPDRQAEILTDSLAKRAGPDAVAKWQGYVQNAGGDVVQAGEAARPWLRSLGITKWVAPPGGSNHQKGEAVDLKYLDPSATQWAHENAPKYGLNFPLSNEDWHIEPAGLRSGAQQQMAATSPQPAGGGAPTMANMQNKTFDPVSDVMNNVRGAFGMAPMAQANTAAPPAAPPPANAPPIPGLTSATGLASADVPPAIQAQASGQPVNRTQNLFGQLALLQAQQPDPQPQVQPIRGPSAEQANALNTLIAALKKRTV